MPYHRTTTRAALLVILMIMPMFIGCAALTPSGAPGCKGPRRPANAHGSVLAPAEPVPASSPAPGGGQCGARP